MIIQYYWPVDLIALQRLEYARLFSERGDDKDALDLLFSITQDWPDWPPAWFELAEKTKDAAHYYRYLKLDPDDRFGAILKLAQLGEAMPPAQPPAAFVESLFDGYAHEFEDALVNRLQYQAPRKLANLLPKQHFRNVLDLGAGTGLMAEALQNRFDRAVAVDLSKEMLKIAETKSLYDEIHIAELHEWLRTKEAEPAEHQFDLVIAADVLSYIGELSELLRLILQALEFGGVFAFTVEASNRALNWHLRPTSRYAHNIEHLRNLLKEAGFSIVSDNKDSLRLDGNDEIFGYYVISKKDSAPLPLPI